MTWFELNQNHDDLSNVLDFLEKAPDKLKFLFDQDSFIDLLNKDFELYKISSSRFFYALEDAGNNLKNEIRKFRSKISIESESYDESFASNANYTLTQIGFTGATLELKANVLNKMWDRVEKAGDGFISFIGRPIVKAIRKFLTYLNSLLGSLSKLVPGVDGLKEIKEIGESYVAIADE